MGRTSSTKRRNSEPIARWRRRAEARPEEILDAALAEFTERGFEAARVEDIAKRAGISKGGVYLYFPSKTALLEALIEARVTPLARLAQTIAATGADDPMSALRMIATAAAHRLGDAKVFAVPRLVISVSGRFPEIAEFYRVHVVDVARGALEQLIEAAMAKGALRRRRSACGRARLYRADFVRGAVDARAERRKRSRQPRKTDRTTFRRLAERAGARSMKRFLILCFTVLAAACTQHTSDALQGYGEADYVYLSSQDPGIVAELFVREGDRVAAGAPIFRLDPQRLGYEAQSAAAQHSAAADAVRTAQANAVLAQRNYARGAQLAAQGFYPRARLDSDRAARDVANAQLAQARREAAAAGAQTGLAQERVQRHQHARARRRHRRADFPSPRRSGRDRRADRCAVAAAEHESALLRAAKPCWRVFRWARG